MLFRSICNSGVGDTDLIVNDSNAGFVIDTMNEKSFNQIADRIVKGELNNFSAEKIRSGAEKFYSLEKGIEKYFSVYQKLSK